MTLPQKRKGASPWYETYVVLDIMPGAEQSYFRVCIPHAQHQPVTICECQEERHHDRCYLSRKHWEAIAYPLQGTFNVRLRAKNFPTARWHVGETFVERLLGKELGVLAWAIEDVPLESIPLALARWSLLTPEERWWLYTETNAATGSTSPESKKGWRTLLRFALAEAPERSWGYHRPPDDQAFLVLRPTTKEGSIRIYERVGIGVHTDKHLLRAQVTREQWHAIASPVAISFREREKSRIASTSGEAPWRTWSNPLPRRLGRELVLLAWGLEGADSSFTPTIYTNWYGLCPEGRWWLYERARENGESLSKQEKGWRAGIATMLRENPV
jgi:hypothetical protein